MNKPTLKLTPKKSVFRSKCRYKKPILRLTLKSKKQEAPRWPKPKITLKTTVLKDTDEYDSDLEYDDLSIDSDQGWDMDYNWNFGDQLQQSHQNPNLAKIDSFLPPKMELDEVMKLNKKQLKALRYIVDQSRVLSTQVEMSLKKRLWKMGYSDDEMMRLRLYIRDEAPIIIHIRPEVLNLMLKNKETHYRNKFEITKKSVKIYTTSGPLTGRIQWENRMFNHIYDKSNPSERVKYGVLNILKDPYGVSTCYGYGDCYLKLRGVRLRTTFADQDTASTSAKIASCEYYNHVLNNYIDRELKAIMNAALDQATYINKGNIIGNYKEIQIHGDIKLREHVELLVVHPKYRGNENVEKYLVKFSVYYDIPMIWMDEY